MAYKNFINISDIESDEFKIGIDEFTEKSSLFKQSIDRNYVLIIIFEYCFKITQSKLSKFE